MFRQWPTKKEEPTRLCCQRNLWIHIWQVEHIPKIHLSCCSWSFEMQHQKSRGEEALAGLPHKRPAAPPVLESPEVASTGANSKRSSTNFFLRTTFIACIAASGMVGTYAIHFESNLFMLEFNPTLLECSRKWWVKISVRAVCKTWILGEIPHIWVWL